MNHLKIKVTLCGNYDVAQHELFMPALERRAGKYVFDLDEYRRGEDYAAECDAIVEAAKAAALGLAGDGVAVEVAANDDAREWYHGELDNHAHSVCRVELFAPEFIAGDREEDYDTIAAADCETTDWRVAPNEAIEEIVAGHLHKVMTREAVKQAEKVCNWYADHKAGLLEAE